MRIVWLRLMFIWPHRGWLGLFGVCDNWPDDSEVWYPIDSFSAACLSVNVYKTIVTDPYESTASHIPPRFVGSHHGSECRRCSDREEESWWSEHSGPVCSSSSSSTQVFLRVLVEKASSDSSSMILKFENSLTVREVMTIISGFRVVICCYPHK